MNMISRVGRALVCILPGLLIVNSLSMVFAQDVRKQGEVRGKISITHSEADAKNAATLDRYSTHRTSPVPPGGAMAPVAKLSEKTVVYLEGDATKGQTFVPPTSHPVLDQKDLAFHPQVLPILAGTTVDFPNKDNLFHNVFSYSSPKEFDLGRYPTGDSKSVRFDKAGIVRVYCDIHSHMNATILVLENPYFAIADDSGSFAIRNVPNGTYTARLWYGRDLAASQGVTIKNGETVTINFTY
jgi:plastocyanin